MIKRKIIQTDAAAAADGPPRKKTALQLALKLYRCEAEDESGPPQPRSSYRPRCFRLSLFGTTLKGKTVCLRVTDFRPFFHVHLALPLTRARFDAFLAWLRQDLCPAFAGGGRSAAPPPPPPSSRGGGAAAWKFATSDGKLSARVERMSIEETYAGEGERDCIRLEFATEKLRRDALKFLRAPDVQVPTALRAPQQQQHADDSLLLDERGARAERMRRGYETYGGKMPSLHAFLHATGLQPTGWLVARLACPRVDPELTWSVGCQAEYEVCMADLTGTPDRLDPAPLLVASYDGEMDSSHGDFPVPIKDYLKPASQIVEMCARHVHGTTVAAATTFLRRALEQMFPDTTDDANRAAAAAEQDDEEEQQKKRLPIDCVYPKQSPFSSAAARAEWMDAMMTLLSSRPLAELMSASSNMRQVLQTLRVAAAYERARQEAEREKERAEAAAATAAKGGGDNNNDDDDDTDGEDDDDEDVYDAPLEGNGGSGGASPIEELLVKSGLTMNRHTFVDVLRAPLSAAAAAAKKGGSSSSGGGGTAKNFFAPPPSSSKKPTRGEEAPPPPALAQAIKTQLLNQLFTLCMPALKGDPVIMIGTVFEGTGDSGANERHIVVAGSCAPIPGAVVHAVADERALLLAWSELMRAKEPHFLLSFNGLGFDNKYFFLRACENGIGEEVFAFSRQRDSNGLAYDWQTKTDGLLSNTTQLQSGEYTMERPCLRGMQQIDLLFYFRREFPNYTSYSLDTVASANLNDAVTAADTVAVEDAQAAAAAANGSSDTTTIELLDWSDPLTVRPRGNRLLRLQSGNLTGLQVGNFVSLQLKDGQLATNYLTQSAWRKYAAAGGAKKEEEEDHGGSGHLNHKIQVLGIERPGDGRQFLLVDAAVAKAAAAQIAEQAAERQAMLCGYEEEKQGEEPTSSSSIAFEPAPKLGPPTMLPGLPVPAVGAGMVWSLVKDDVPHKEIFRLGRGSATDRAIVGKYCIGDCQLPLVLARKLGVIAWYLETAALCYVDVSTLVFNGQGVKLQSYVGKACLANRTLLRDLEKENVAYDGATVLEPRCAAYNEEPVGVNDFSSLYPSIMAGWNLSPGTRVWAVYYLLGNVPGPKKGGPNLPYLDGGGLGAPFAYEGVLRPPTDRRRGQSPFLFHGMPGREYVYTWYTLKKRVPSPNGGRKQKSVAIGNKLVCWLVPAFADATHSAASHPHQAGVYPQQALGLLAARQEKKKLQKQPGLDPFTKAVYKLQELVVKTSNNSVYGQLGSATSALRDLDVAASICSIGRLHIMYTKTLVEKLYGDRVVRVAPFGALRSRSCYVYGDTDSVFFCFNLETVDPAEYPDAFQFADSSKWTGVPQRVRGRVALQCAIVLATKVAELVTATGPQPMALAYEKTMMRFFIVSKKKYAGYLYVDDPDKYKELKLQGLTVKKRDSCDCVRDVFGTVMQRMLKDADDVAPMARYLAAVVKRILSGALPASRFMITKTLKSGYAKPMTVPHNVLADRIEQRAPGTRPRPGDRITYAFVCVDPRTTQGLGSNGAIVLGQRIDTLEHILTAGVKVDYEEYVRAQVMQPVVQLMSLLAQAVADTLGTAADRAELARARAAAAPHEETDFKLYNAILRTTYTRVVQRIVFGPFLRELDNKNRGLRDISGFFGGGQGTEQEQQQQQQDAAVLQQLGRVIHNVPSAKKRALTTTTTDSAAAPAAKLQKTMKQFFAFGGSGRR